MHQSDRRIAPRFRISIPVHFRLVKSAEPACVAESLNVSRAGMCVETEAPLRIGAILQVQLRMPEMITAIRAPEWRIISHVVHVESSVEWGKYDVGMQFHYYEALVSQGSRVLTDSDPMVPPQVDAHQEGKVVWNNKRPGQRLVFSVPVVAYESPKVDLPFLERTCALVVSAYGALISQLTGWFAAATLHRT